MCRIAVPLPICLCLFHVALEFEHYELHFRLILVFHFSLAYIVLPYSLIWIKIILYE